jgi:hypothetical protein
MALVPAKYTAKAYVLLAPPPASPAAVKAGQPNPYQYLGGMQWLADVLSRAMTSGDELLQLRRAGLNGTYAVQRDLTTDSPIVIITTSARTSTAALNDLSLVSTAVQPQLTSLQSSVAPQYRVTARTLATATMATASHKSQTRALLVALVAGIVGTFVVISATDAMLLRRRGSGHRRVFRTTGGAAPQPQDAMVQSSRRLVGAAQLRSRARQKPDTSESDVGVTARAAGLESNHSTVGDAFAVGSTVSPTPRRRRGRTQRSGERRQNDDDRAPAEVGDAPAVGATVSPTPRRRRGHTHTQRSGERRRNDDDRAPAEADDASDAENFRSPSSVGMPSP